MAEKAAVLDPYRTDPSAIGVAFSHGANDGQKGIGLVMLVLIGVAPAGFVVNMNASGYERLPVPVMQSITSKSSSSSP